MGPVFTIYDSDVAPSAQSSTAVLHCVHVIVMLDGQQFGQEMLRLLRPCFPAAVLLQLQDEAEAQSELQRN